MIHSRILLLLAILGLSLASCKKSGNSSTPAAPAPAAPPALTFPFLLSFGSSGAGNGQFNGNQGIAVDSVREVLYVADTFNDRIQRFDLDGNYQAQWNCAVGCGGAFNDPLGITLDPAGYIYTTDSANNRIVKLDPNGNFVTAYGGPGSAVGQFTYPVGIWVDQVYSIWVADFNNNRIQFRNAGTGVWTARGGYTTPAGIAADSNTQYYYVSEQSGDRIRRHKYDLSSSVTIATAGTGDGQVDAPVGLNLDRDGNLWVVEFNNDRVQKLSPTGAFLAKFGTSGTLPGQFGSSNFFALDDDQNVYVSDPGNLYVHKFAPY